jgi:hypothetical protein
MNNQQSPLTPELGRYVVEKVLETMRTAKDHRTAMRAVRLIIKMVDVDRQAERQEKGPAIR